MRMIDAAAVHRLLDWPGVIEALRVGHCGPAPKQGRAMLDQPRSDRQPDILIVSAAWQDGEALGVKLVTSFPGNVAEYGLPTVDALYVLFDPRTGKSRAVIDGEALIFRKTAADTALGASFLASPDASRLLMVGAGALAPYLVDALRVARPGLREVRIWNRTPDRAQHLAERLRAQGWTGECVLDLEDALPWADIVVSATMSSEPLVKGALLKPGAHVNLVGSFTPAMREGDDDLIRRAWVFVDDYGVLDRSGEFIEPLRRGVIAREDVRGDLFALCQGRRAGPIPNDAVTLFKNGGAGQLDLFVANHLLSRAESETQ